MRIAILFLSLCCLIAATGSQALAAGQLSVSQDHLTFGTLTEGVVARKDVTLSNNGDSPLTIANVSTSCSCTTTKLGKDTLAPGESTKLEIVYNTYKFPGKFEKYVYIQWSEDKNNKMTITMIGEVTPIPMGVLSVDPRKIPVGTIHVGEPKSVNIFIKNTGDAPMQVNKIVGKKSGLIFFDATNKGPLLLKPGQNVPMPITVTASTPGNYVEYIIIESNARNVTADGYKVVIVGEAK